MKSSKAALKIELNYEVLIFEEPFIRALFFALHFLVEDFILTRLNNFGPEALGMMQTLYLSR